MQAEHKNTSLDRYKLVRPISTQGSLEIAKQLCQRLIDSASNAPQ